MHGHLFTLLLFTTHFVSSSSKILSCPPTTHVECSKEAQHGSIPIQLTIQSITEEAINLYWVNLDCKEQYWSSLAPGASIIVTTYSGHLWRAKSKLDNAVVLEYLTPPTTSTDDPTAHVQVDDCKRNDGHHTGSDKDVNTQETLGHMNAINIVTTTSVDDYQQVWDSIATEFPHCNPQQDLSAVKVPGFYVLCAANKRTTEQMTLRVAGFRSLTDSIVTFECPEAALASPLGMRYCLKTGLKLKHDFKQNANPPQLPNWVMWEASGRRKVHVANQMVPARSTKDNNDDNDNKHTTGRLFIFTGGNFVWPGVKIGFQRSVGTVAGRDKPVTIQTMSLRPLVFQVVNFLSTEECDHIVGLAKPHMGASVVTHMDGDEGKSDTTWRTSTTHFLSRGQTELAQQIERRIFDMTRIPITHGEGTQVLRYEKHQHYFTHHDYFEASRYSNSKSTLNMIEHGAKNRLATVFWYMSDVSKGGHTNFPRAGGLSESTARNNKCTQGLMVEPRKGKVIIFFNMLPNGLLDPDSLHAGCNVESDEVKWSANKWLWNKPTRGLWMGEKKDHDLQALADNVPGAVDDTITENLLASALGKDREDGAYGRASDGSGGSSTIKHLLGYVSENVGWKGSVGIGLGCVVVVFACVATCMGGSGRPSTFSISGHQKKSRKFRD